MDLDSPLANEVRRRIGADGRIRGVRGIRVNARGRDVFLEGVVGDVASKKLALEHAGAARGAGAVIDRLHVRPSTKMSDSEICERIRNELLDEPTLANHTLRFRANDNPVELPHAPFPDAPGRIDVRVEEGAVTLDGEVPSLAHKRIAGVLAWWVSGVVDVVNGLGVEPPEEDSDDEIVDALRIVFEKDRLLDSSEIQVGCKDRLVVLEGAVPTQRQSHMAEFDAWCVFGVDRVENRLHVRPLR